MILEKINLGTEQLSEIGSFMESKLMEIGMDGSCVVSLTMDKYNMLRIEEDLFYKQGGKKEDYRPSDEKIEINVGKCKIIIKTK